jgi:hypothetical protein
VSDRLWRTAVATKAAEAQAKLDRGEEISEEDAAAIALDRPADWQLAVRRRVYADPPGPTPWRWRLLGGLAVAAWGTTFAVGAVEIVGWAIDRLGW